MNTECGGGVFVPNIKSAKKRVLVSKAQNEKNKAAKSLLKTNVKKFENAAASGDKEALIIVLIIASVFFGKRIENGSIHLQKRAFPVLPRP